MKYSFIIFISLLLLFSCSLSKTILTDSIDNDSLEKLSFVSLDSITTQEEYMRHVQDCEQLILSHDDTLYISSFDLDQFSISSYYASMINFDLYEDSMYSNVTLLIDTLSLEIIEMRVSYDFRLFQLLDGTITVEEQGIVMCVSKFVDSAEYDKLFSFFEHLVPTKKQLIEARKTIFDDR